MARKWREAFLISNASRFSERVNLTDPTETEDAIDLPAVLSLAPQTPQKLLDIVPTPDRASAPSYPQLLLRRQINVVNRNRVACAACVMAYSGELERIVPRCIERYRAQVVLLEDTAAVRVVFVL